MLKLNGCKFGIIAFLACICFGLSSPAQTFQSLVSFNGTNGAIPHNAVLVQGVDGNLYGTTGQGGLNNCRGTGCGTVFRMTPDGMFTTLYNFCSMTGCIDGEFPQAGLVLATDRNLYGTTETGGKHESGTIFRITPSGNFTVVYNFCQATSCADGAQPYSPLVEGDDGYLYGTTAAGGSNQSGTIFKLSPAGILTTIYNFCSPSGCAGPYDPYAGLIQGTDGNFYGTTIRSGPGQGSAYRVTSGGAFSTLHIFFCDPHQCSDGAEPVAGVMQATNGNLYGTTYQGGNLQCGQAGGCGVVYQISPGDVITPLYTFNGPDGKLPQAGLVQGTDGNLYGTTEAGGSPYNCCGTIFQLTPSGVLTEVHDFENAQGEFPDAAPFQATNGVFYGTTSQGGNNGQGIIYSLDMGLGPFVSFIIPAGKVGATGGILGQGFTGTTSVMLNGVSANFTVVSDTFIQATVPQGATTGYVTVSTPSGVLTSNVPFRVIP